MGVRQVENNFALFQPDYKIKLDILASFSEKIKYKNVQFSAKIENKNVHSYMSKIIL
jgi:hypothetical protein